MAQVIKTFYKFFNVTISLAKLSHLGGINNSSKLRSNGQTSNLIRMEKVENMSNMMNMSNLFTRTSNTVAKGISSGFTGSVDLLSSALFRIRLLLVSQPQARISPQNSEDLRSFSRKQSINKVNDGKLGHNQGFIVPRLSTVEPKPQVSRFNKVAHQASFMAERGIEKIFA